MSFSPTEIDEILKIQLTKNCSNSHTNNYNKIQAITPAIRASFAKKFVLQFADNYDSHFSEVLSIISTQSFCGSGKEAIFLYSIIADHLRKIVILNSDPNKRFCSKNSITSLLTEGKKAIFRSTFIELKSRKNYIDFLKSKARIFLSNQKNCIIIGKLPKSASIRDIVDLIEFFLRNYLKSAACDLNPPLFLVKDELVKELKQHTIKANRRINDGYEEILFRPDFLTSKPVATRKVINNKATDSLGDISFEVRIAGLSKLPEIVNCYTPDRIMYFDVSEVDEWNDVPMFLTEDLDLSEMSQLMKVGK